MCESGGDGGGGGNAGGATGQAGYGGGGIGSAEADSGYGTSSSGWGAAESGSGSDSGGGGGSSAGPSGKGNADAASASRGIGRSAFDDATSRRDSLENTSLTEKGLLGDPGMSVSIDAVDPNSGAQSYGAPTNSTTTNQDGSVSIGLDLSSLDPDAMRGWARNPQMARNYSALAREDDNLSNTLGNMVAAAQPNGWKGLAATGIGLLSGTPAVGMGLNAAIDADQAQGFRGAAFGIDTDLGQNVSDFGRSFGRSAVGSVAGMATGSLGSRLGGSIAGVPGAAIGGFTASQFGKGLLGDAGTSSPGAADTGFGPAGDNGIDVASNAPGSVSAPGSISQSANTGWGSTFGNYGSHLGSFKSYGADSALNAFS